MDRAYFARARGEQGVYHVYHLHNDHFLIWSAMFQGRYEDAIAHCDKLMEHMPPPMQDNPLVSDWFATHLHVMLRFGKWDEILASDEPPAAIASSSTARTAGTSVAARRAESLPALRIGDIPVRCSTSHT